MKKITLSEVMERSSEDGLVVHKYQNMRCLQRTLYLLLDGAPQVTPSPNPVVTDLNKMYYVQDYKNNQFYYKCTEAFFDDLKLNIDDYLTSLIKSIAGMTEVKYGLTSPMKTSKEMLEKFKNKINSQEIITTEV